MKNNENGFCGGVESLSGEIPKKIGIVQNLQFMDDRKGLFFQARLVLLCFEHSPLLGKYVGAALQLEQPESNDKGTNRIEGN